MPDKIEEPLYQELSALEQAMESEEKQEEGSFLTGGNRRAFKELEEERELDESMILEVKKKISGVPLLEFLQTNLHKFDSPYAYIGGEANSPMRERFKKSEVKILQARLSTYDSVSLSMSHSLMVQIYQELEYTFCDLTFLPKPKDYELLKSNGFPVWFGTNTKLGPEHFDILSITHAVSMEQLNFVGLLVDSGIPLFKEQRMEREDIPLVVVGGANAGTVAPLCGEYVSKDGKKYSTMIDAMIYGEGEEAAKILAEQVREGKKKGLKKSEILRSCHGVVPGLYEPDRYNHEYDGKGKLVAISRKPGSEFVELPVKRATVIDLNEVRTLENKILPFSGDGASVDVAIAGSVGCIGSAGLGACSFSFMGDQRLSTEKGMLTFEQLKGVLGAKKFEQPINLKVMTEEGVAKATIFYVQKAKKSLTVRTYDGYEVKTSKDHHIRVYDREKKELVYKLVTDLEGGDLIATVYKDPPKYTGKSQLTEQEALFVGLMLSSGVLYMDKTKMSSRLYLGKNNVQFYDKVRELLLDLFGDGNYTLCERDIGGGLISLGKRHIIGAYKRLGLKKEASRDRSIPDVIWGESPRVQRAFLSGLLSGNGRCSSKNVQYRTSSGKLAKETQALLGHLGIRSFIRRYKTASKGEIICRGSESNVSYEDRYVWALGLSGVFAKKFVEEVGMFYDHKLDLYEGAVHKQVPYTVNKWIKNGIERISKKEKRELWEEKGVILSPYKESVEGEVEDTYDITVPGPHNVVVNGGVVVHNCREGSEGPYRERSLPKVMDALSKAVVNQGSKEVSFFCFSGDTLIWTESGLMRIDEIGYRDETSDSRVQDMSRMVKYGAWVKRSVQKTLVVRTGDGEELTVTPDHKIVISRKGEEMVSLVQAKDLKIGDRAYSLLGGVPEKYVNQSLVDDAKAYVLGRKASKVFKPKELFRIYTTEEDKVALVNFVQEAVPGVLKNDRSGIYWESKGMYMDFHTSDRVPRIIRCGGLRTQAMYIRGVFDSGYNVSAKGNGWSRMYIQVKQKQRARETSAILRALGMRTYIAEVSRTAITGDSFLNHYEVGLQDYVSVEKYMEVVGTLNEKLRKRIEALKDVLKKYLKKWEEVMGGVKKSRAILSEVVEIREGPEQETYDIENTETSLLVASGKWCSNSLNFNMYTSLFPLVYESVKKGYKVGLISQRVDMLAEVPEQVRVQRYLHKANFTLGIEGISGRMRAYLNKNLQEWEILKVIVEMIEAGASELKLFYIACLPAGERIVTNDGLVPVEECKALKTYDGEVRDIVRWVRKGPMRILKIETNLGQRVRVAADHMMKKKDGKWVLAKELRIDDELKLGLGSLEVEKDPINLSPTKAEILGFTVGDGYNHKGAGKGFTICFNYNDSEERSYLGKMLNRLRWVYSSNVKKGIYYCNGGLPQYWKKYMEGTSRTKRVPEPIFRATIKTRRAYVRGYYQADGTVTAEGFPSITTLSENLARDVQQLLFSLGVVAKIHCYSCKSFKGKRVWMIHIRAESIPLFREIVEGCPKYKRIRTSHYKAKRSSARVVSIEEDGEEEVYSPEVKDTKTYFGTGLVHHNSGMEAQRDLDEMCAFMEKANALKEKMGSSIRFRVSFTPLFPSAFTALQFAPAFAALKHGSRSLDQIFNKARELGWGRRLSVSGEEPLISNTINHGGRNIMGLLIDSHCKDDFRFYGNVPKGTWARWKRRIEQDPNIDLNILWGQKDYDYIFPWEDITYSTAKETLWRGYLKACAFQGISYCVDEKALVKTHRGLVRLKDVKVGEDMVWSRGGWVSVNDKKMQEVEKHVEIRFKNGMSLRVTEEHDILKAEKTCDWKDGKAVRVYRDKGFTYAKDLKPDNWVRVELESDENPHNGMLEGRRVDDKLMYVLGVYRVCGMREGNIVSWLVNETEAWYIQQLKGMVREVFGVETYERRHGRTKYKRIDIEDEKVADWIARAMTDDTLWLSVYTMSVSERASFIRGLFDIDGAPILSGGDNPVLKISYMNERFEERERVQQVLLSLGIDSSNSRITKEMRISTAQSIGRYAERVDFLSEWKSKALFEGIEGTKGTIFGKVRVRAGEMYMQVEEVVQGGPLKVGDIEVGGENEFTANGVVVHNCITTKTIKGVCHVNECGACDPKGEGKPELSIIENIVGRKVAKEIPVEEMEKAARSRERAFTCRVLFEVRKPIFRFVQKAYYQHAIPRALMKSSSAFEDAFISSMGHIRSQASANTALDWTYGRNILDFSLCKNISELELKKAVEEANKIIGEQGSIIDLRLDQSQKSFSYKDDFAAYGMIAPSSMMTFRTIQQAVTKYFEKRQAGKGVTVKVKEVKGKGMFKTVEKHLDESEVRQVRFEWVPELRGTYIWAVASVRHNVLSMMEAITGRRSYHWKPLPVFCEGYITIPEDTGDKDIFACLEGGDTECIDCGEEVEIDLYSGERLKGGRCLSCKKELEELDLSMFEKDMLLAVDNGEPVEV